MIAHPKGGHDDYPNALALAVAELAKSLHPAADGSVYLPRVPGHGGEAARVGRDPDLALVGAAADGRTAFWGSPRGGATFWRRRTG